MQVKEQLTSGSLAAYIFDKPILQYWDSVLDPNCALGFLDGFIEPFDYGVAFNQVRDDWVAGRRQGGKGMFTGGLHRAV